MGVRLYWRIEWLDGCAGDQHQEDRRRLGREGWICSGGKRHDVFTHPKKPGRVVARHREQTVGVARQIAKEAGWSD